LLDRHRDFLDRLNRSSRCLLDRYDVPGDLFGGLSSLCGKAYDLLGATTAKLRPASPARAASIVVLSASRLVCAAMLLMTSLTSPISSTDAERPLTASVIAFASLVAWPAMVAELATRATMCSIDCAISSAARIIGGDDGFFGFVAVVDRFEFKLPAIHPTGAIGVFKGRENALAYILAERLGRAVEGGNFAENDLIVRYAVGRTQPLLQKARADSVWRAKKRPHQRGV
jgi:hypothetical protein